MRKCFFIPVIVFTVMAAAMVLNSCISTNKLTTRNYDHLYKRTSTATQFRGRLLHQSDSSSLYIFRIYLPGLKYEKEEDEDNYTATYSLFYEIYSSYTSNEMVDTSTVVYEDSLYFARDKFLTHQIVLPVNEGLKGHMEITFTDKNSGKKLRRYYRINKTKKPGQQNFLFRTPNRRVHFPHFSRYYTDYRIQYRKSRDKLRADVFSADAFSIADPPFVPNLENEIGLDKQETTSLPDNQIKVSKKPLLYHIKTRDSQQATGLFYTAPGDFPKARSLETRINALRYITTNKEYTTIQRASDPKAALEDYWYKAGGDSRRAFNLREKYYERVEMANILYTSYKAGWKTDRGMLYIVMGPPDIVHFYENSEEWIYGKPGNIESLKFRFERSTEPFAFNNFVLERKEEYRLPWYKAVEKWKK